MKRKPQLGIDQLEDRRLMTVTVFESGNDLFINGDGASDMIQVYRLSNDQIRIEGIAGSGTTVNGRSRAQFDVNDDIYIDLGEGNNWLDIRNLNGGVDADYVKIQSGGGNDKLWMTGLNTTNDLRIESGGGNDDIQVSGSQIGNGSFDDLKIYTGAGNDSVRVNTTNVRQDVVIQTFDSVWANEADDVDLQFLTVGDDLYVDTGAGNDEVRVQRAHVDDYMRVRTGDGNDYVFMHNDNTIDDDLRIDTGDGHDVLGVYRTVVKDDATLDGGDDFDRLYTFDLDVDGDLDEDNWESVTRY